MTNGLRRRLRGYLCIYCGMLANCDDHFPPRSLCYLGWLLPSCKECNYIAGTKWPLNFTFRAELVKDSLRRKYFSELTTPDWSDEELDELEYNLRNEVIRWQKRKSIIQERLAWNAISYLSSIDQCKDFVKWLVEIDTTTKRESEILKSLSELNE